MTKLRLNRHRAKWAVLTSVASVLLLQLGMNVAIDTVKPEWRDPEYGHRMKDLREQAAANPSQPVVVVLGSSRPLMGFNPMAMGSGDGVPNPPIVYNCAQTGCGPVYELLNLKRLVAAGVKPNFVLVEIIPAVLAGKGAAEKLVPTSHLGYSDVVQLEPYLAHPRALWFDWVCQRISPWYTYRIILLSHTKAANTLPSHVRQDWMWKHLQPNGWLPYTFKEIPAAKREDGIEKARAGYLPYFDQFEIAPLPGRTYRDLIAFAQSRNIQVAFFTMPESPIFRSWYPDVVRQKLTVYYASLTHEFGTPVFDATDWLADETAFADGHHLMRHGAEAFSERFGKECLKPWLNTKR